MSIQFTQHKRLISNALAVAAFATAASLYPIGVFACGLTISTNFTLEKDLVGCAGDGIVVTGDNLTIDLDGHSILGLRKERTAGIRLSGVSGVTIENGTVASFERGIYLTNTKDVIVDRVAVNANRYEGLMAYQSSAVSVVDSSFANNTRAAIWIYDSDAELIRNLGLDNPNRTFYLSGGQVTLSENVVRGGSYYSAFTVADGYIPVDYKFGDNLVEDVIGAGYLFAWGFGGSVTDLGGNRAKNTGSVACWTEEGVSCPLDLTADSTGPVCGDGICEAEESVFSCTYDCGLPPAESCGDGIDNDGDSAVDCDDAEDCALNPICEPAPFCGPPSAACSTDDDCCSRICRTSASGNTANSCR